MKFGGTSVADAARIGALVSIVEARLERRPLVVVSALAGVTDRLEQALDAAQRDDRERLEPVLAEIDRRHRWALEGCIPDTEHRHRCSVELTERCDRLRGRLRSVRILGEGTPRAAAAVLAFGELTSSWLVCEALQARGVPAGWIDPRELIVTDGRATAVDKDAVRRAAETRIAPLLAAGSVAVTGGFVGRDTAGETVTLGRGGSDTTAAVLGAALGVEEIQIWTDVDGMMTADPKRVATARTLPRLSFSEAAELALRGARVLHPPSVTPAVEASIPVRVLNSFRPEREGTTIVQTADDERAHPWSALASRAGIRRLVVSDPRMRDAAGFLDGVLDAARRCGAVCEGLWSSGAAVGLAVREPFDGAGFVAALPGGLEVESVAGRALVTVVGEALRDDAGARGRVVADVAGQGPEWVGTGATGGSVMCIVAETRLDAVLTQLHRRFFEEGAGA